MDALATICTFRADGGETDTSGWYARQGQAEVAIGPRAVTYDGVQMARVQGRSDGQLLDDVRSSHPGLVEDATDFVVVREDSQMPLDNAAQKVTDVIAASRAGRAAFPSNLVMRARATYA